jgi:hypothetical protein
MGMTIDMKENVFRPPKTKLDIIAAMAKHVLTRAEKNKR